MWPRAIPTRPACDSRGQRESASSSNERPMPNAQRPTPNLESRSPLPASRGRRFVDRANNCPDDDHLNEAAHTTVNNQFPGNRLHRVKAKAHTDRCYFEQDTKTNPRERSAASKPSPVDHYEGENDECLPDNDPMKQTQHITLRAPQIW